MNGETELPLVEAAMKLSLSYGQAWRMLLTGRLDGRKVRGRWVVSSESLEQALETNDPNGPWPPNAGSRRCES